MAALNVLIAGAGIGGLTAALCLARAGMRVAVFEQSREFGEIGAGIQLSPNGTRVLHHIGLASELAERAVSPLATEFRSWKTAETINSIPLGKTVLERYGFPYYHLHRDDLLGVLATAARRCPGIELHAGAPVEGFRQADTSEVLKSNGDAASSASQGSPTSPANDARSPKEATRLPPVSEKSLTQGAIGPQPSQEKAPQHTESRRSGVAERTVARHLRRVELDVAGRTHHGDALVGADGIHSQVRRALVGDGRATFTGNIAWRALVPAERVPEGLRNPVGTVWWGPGSHVVCYFVRGGALLNCVFVTEKRGWEVESWTERGEHEELKSDFAGWHPDIQTIIDNADRGSLFKWALHDRPPMRNWGRGVVTLLGDACHPTLPFQAQGAAMAIEDAAVLANCLSCNDDIETALQRYETLRRQRTAAVQRGSRRNARIFHLRGARAWFRNRAAKRAGQHIMHNLFAYDALSVG